MIEQWLPVNDFEDLYQVSSLGRIRSLDRVVTQIDGRTRPFPSRLIGRHKNKKTGYVQVTLSRGGKYHLTYAHRIVARAFVPNPQNKKCVNHIDGVRSNNIASNLEWCTHAENIQHAHATGLAKALSGDQSKTRKISSVNAASLRADVWSVIQAWSERHGVHTQTAWDIIAGRNWVRPPA